MIAVASGKGGVGKSTLAANLAVALAARGQRVGLLDADVYGPSQPRTLGVSGRPSSPDGKTILPLRNHGVTLMSIGLMTGDRGWDAYRGDLNRRCVTLAEVLSDNEDGCKGKDKDGPPGTGRSFPSRLIEYEAMAQIAMPDARQGMEASNRRIILIVSAP